MTNSLTRRAAVLSGVSSAVAMPFIRRAYAEGSVVVVSRLFGTQSLQQDVMEQRKLVEKYAASFGLPGLRATYPRFAGATLANEGLMAGTIHMAGGTIPGAIALWDRTEGGVKTAMALNASNPRLLTTNPAVKTIADLTAADRIAMPAVSISPQAVYLQMAAVKALGPSAWSKFDKQTLGRAHPESVRSLLMKKDISCHFSASPYQESQLRVPGVHEVTNGFTITGHEDNTPFAMYSTVAYRTANPQTWLAVSAAFQEATDWILENPSDAAQLYLDNTGEKSTAPEVLAAMNAPGNAYTLQPRGVMQIANFMADTGVIKRRPARIEDLFFPELLETGGT